MCPQDDDRDPEHTEVLLIREVAIDCHEHIEVLVGEGEKSAVDRLAPTHLLNRRGIDAGKVAKESPIKALVEKAFIPLPAASSSSLPPGIE
jgi:hypothetical protein